MYFWWSLKGWHRYKTDIFLTFTKITWAEANDETDWWGGSQVSILMMLHSLLRRTAVVSFSLSLSSFSVQLPQHCPISIISLSLSHTHTLTQWPWQTAAVQAEGSSYSLTLNHRFRIRTSSIYHRHYNYKVRSDTVYLWHGCTVTLRQIWWILHMQWPSFVLHEKILILTGSGSSIMALGTSK